MIISYKHMRAVQLGELVLQDPHPAHWKPQERSYCSRRAVHLVHSFTCLSLVSCCKYVNVPLLNAKLAVV
jgi:hypothetical protein